MGDGDAKAKKPQLPAGVPKDLDAFIECTSASVTIKSGKVGWVGKLDLGVTEIEPEISFEAGEKGAINLSVGKGFVAITLPASITDGQLTIDTGNLPQAGADFVNGWVKDLNGWLKSKGKQFGAAKLEKGGVTLTKVPVAAVKPVDQKVKAAPDRARLVVLAAAALLVLGAAFTVGSGVFGDKPLSSAGPSLGGAASTYNPNATVPNPSVPSTYNPNATVPNKIAVIKDNVLVDNVGTPCSTPTTMHAHWVLTGVPEGSKVVVDMSGPGLPAETTFTVGADGSFGKDYTIPAGPGAFTSKVVSIDGAPAPASNATNKASITCG